MRTISKFAYLFVFSFLFSGCFLNQSIMFKTNPDYKYSQTPDYKKVQAYKISPNDILVFDIYTNNGFNLINLTSFSATGSAIQASSAKPEYIVDADGYVKLPIIGKKKISGLTIREVETLLEQSFSEFYLNPFAVAKITNRRVIYFTGNSSAAKVISLTDNNTTVLQMIAKEGGLDIYGKARKIKLIRNVNGNHEVYLLDLSTIKGIDDAHIVLQANDIIYVDPRRRVSSKALTEIAPIISLFSSSLLIIAVINNLKK
jgi:polysaccharide export outer membrane protein